MNDKLSISIILPCFNVEKYVSTCLDSLYSQNIEEKEYEIICVNDDSPDKTRDIIVEYQRKHTNIFLLEHKKNKKQGAARNTGLKHAKGKYVWFIDPDDFIKTNVVPGLINHMERENLEILQFDANFVDETGLETNNIHNYNLNINSECITGHEYIDINIPFWEKPVECWRKIFNRDFLLSNQIFFPEVCFTEDDFHSLHSLLKVNRMKLISDRPIFYRIRENSTMTSEATSWRNARRTSDQVYLSILSLNTIDQSIVPQKTKITLTEHCAYFINNSQKAIFFFPLSEKYFFFNRIKGIEKGILVKYISPKNCVCYHPKLFLFFSIIFSDVLSIVRKIKRSVL